MSRVGQPRWAMDNRMVVPSKPVPTIKKKDTRHGPARPEKIEEMLNDPMKRKHLGPCCVSKDGMLRGEKKWGDGAGSSDGNGGKVYVCMGCRKLLDREVCCLSSSRGRFGYPRLLACMLRASSLARHAFIWNLTRVPALLGDSLLSPRRS